MQNGDAVDRITLRLEAAQRRVRSSIGSRVRAPSAELDLLETCGYARDLIGDLLRTTGGNRGALEGILGEGGSRLNRITAALEVSGSTTHGDDRMASCRNACSAAERVLGREARAPQLSQPRSDESWRAGDPWRPTRNDSPFIVQAATRKRRREPEPSTDACGAGAFGDCSGGGAFGSGPFGATDDSQFCFRDPCVAPPRRRRRRASEMCAACSIQ